MSVVALIRSYVSSLYVALSSPSSLISSLKNMKTALLALSVQAAAAQQYPQYPQYHVAPDIGHWLNDPNGILFRVRPPYLPEAILYDNLCINSGHLAAVSSCIVKSLLVVSARPSRQIPSLFLMLISRKL